MTVEVFSELQQNLILVFGPFIVTWTLFYIAGSVLAAILIVFLSVAGELLHHAI